MPPAAPAKTIFFFLEMLRGHKEDLDKAAHLSFTFFNLFVLKESFFREVFKKSFFYEKQYNTDVHIHAHTLIPMNTHAYPTPMSTFEILSRQVRS